MRLCVSEAMCGYNSLHFGKLHETKSEPNTLILNQITLQLGGHPIFVLNATACVHMHF